MQDEDIRTLLAGDANAWERLVTTYHRLVLWVLKQAGVPESRREDVAQEVWIKVYRGLAGWHRRTTLLPPGASRELYLKAWIGTIATNCARDDYRRRLHHPEVALQDSMAASSEDELPAVLWRDGLTAEEQLVLQHYLGGETPEAIGKRLGKSQTTVYRTLQGIREKLREQG
jgi:RNA polymerase sigma factor (sigma-70 family)